MIAAEVEEIVDPVMGGETPTAGEPVDKTRLTQVGRALKQLGIKHIPSYWPEGRGRMERLFGTLQSRLPPLMRLEGLASIEAANRWLATVYIPHHNARFAVAAAEEGTAFVPFVGALDDILCVQEERVVRNDNTVRYGGRVLQIPEQRHRRHFVKATVRVHAIPGWPACDLPRSALARRLRGGRNPDRSDPPVQNCCVSPLRSKACGRRGRALLAHPAHRPAPASEADI